MDSARIPRPSPAIPPAPRGHRPRISATPETLPPGQAARPWAIPNVYGKGLDHYVVYLDLDQITNDVELLEETYRALRGPIRPQVWQMLATPDPDVDPAGYWAARWWRQGMTATLDMILAVETQGRAYPWHHGRSPGPVLSPSRA